MLPAIPRIPMKNTALVALPNLPPDKADANHAAEMNPAIVMPDHAFEFPDGERVINEDNSDSDGDVFADAEEAINATEERPPLDFFHPPDNLAVPTQPFSIPRSLRNVPIKGASALSTRSKSKGGPD